MSRVATAELGLASTAVADNNGGGFDVFLSLRSGAGGEDFSSGIDDIGEEVNIGTDEAAGKLDLVAVAGGKEKLDTAMSDASSQGNSKVLTPVDALSLAGKSEINSSENQMSDERRAAICQGVASAACASCAARDDCPILRMRNFANENLQPAPERESYLRDLLSDDDDGIVVAGYANPDSGADSTNADITETSDDKTDKLIEQVAPPNQGDEIPTSETTESPDEPADIKEAEQLFLESAIVMEDAADDVDEIREAQPEIVSEVSVNTSGEEYFTEPTEENRPSIEIKQQTPAIISDAVDKESEQPAFESSDIPTQTQTKTVSSSPGASEDTQTANENNTLPKNETANFLSGEGKPVDSVVENTYDGDETTAPSSVKTPSIERQKEKVFVITGSKSANFEPSRAAENDESATPVSEQQHLAARFDAVRADESATTGPIDNSGTKASTDAQPSEISIDAAPDYNNFVESTDGVDVEQPKHVIPTASNVSPYQEQEDAVNVSAEYETNETSTEKMVNAAASIPAKEQPDQPVIVSLSAQDIVEYGEDNEAWAEEDMVFFVEQQAPSSVELNVSSAEMVTIALSMEATTVREEVDDLKPSVDDEISVDMDSAGQLDNSKAVSVPEVTNDYEPVEQIVIPISPAVELIPDVELDEPVVEILEERIMPREERDNIVMKASEKSDLLCLDAEVETITMDTSGIESVVDLSEAQAELAAAEVSEAVESEVDEQNDLAVDSYGYNSEMSAVSDNVLVVKSRPSPGLWPDDSQLNPEEEFTTTTQSSADDSSLVSRLVGMFVVAMCVVRGRQSVKV
ncbi:Rad2 family DNA repair protein [Candidatus Nanosynbacter lyticus]|uniref:hypothetical protein n=1 Tax=Candidatus Nanosynbacter lyticus TaxID=2093824 RepID=UPI002552FE36|nr:hypothetical protein [Candidatus Nanosynbacter lyticus]WLD47207.1 hypothetical protein NLML1_0856 [Candidatus Nanosynbacter lyticus]